MKCLYFQCVFSRTGIHSSAIGRGNVLDAVLVGEGHVPGDGVGNRQREAWGLHSGRGLQLR